MLVRVRSQSMTDDERAARIEMSSRDGPASRFAERAVSLAKASMVSLALRVERE